MPTILHVVASLGRGGTEVHAADIIGTIKDRDDAVNKVVSLVKGDEQLRQRFEQETSTIVDVLPIGRAARGHAFWSILKVTRPDAVMFHFFNTEHVFLGLLARLSGVRHIAATAGNPAPRLGMARRGTWRLLLRASWILKCPIASASNWIAETLAQLGPMPAGSCVIHNGCDVGHLAARANATRAALTSDTVVIGMVARLDPIKDHLTLLRAFAKLISQLDSPVIELMLVGGGKLAPELRKEARSLGLEKKVHFTGPRSDIPEALAEMDVFALSTTVEEGFGIVLIEALAAGVPVIASDVPACREVLRGGELGELVVSGDADALSAALSRAVLNRPSAPPADTVASYYGLARVADDYLDILTLRPEKKAP